MLTVASPSLSAAGASPITTQTFTLAGPLVQCSIAPFGPCISAVYRNNSNSTVLGIVFAVLRNSFSQTVYYTTGTVQLPSGQSNTAYLVLQGVPSGSYNATVFAINAYNVPISVASTILVGV